MVVFTVAAVVVDEEEFVSAVAEALVPAAVDDSIPFILAVELFVFLPVALVAAPESVPVAVIFPGLCGRGRLCILSAVARILLFIEKLASD